MPTMFCKIPSILRARSLSAALERLSGTAVALTLLILVSASTIAPHNTEAFGEDGTQERLSGAPSSSRCTGLMSSFTVAKAALTWNMHLFCGAPSGEQWSYGSRRTLVTKVRVHTSLEVRTA